jgi:predicted MFS family arabinose efflux permease
MKEKIFSRYEAFIIAILTVLQFTVVLDFMVLSPLGEFVMRDLDILPLQFAVVVSAYAVSAGISGFLAAGFADRFDRKKMLIFFYAGFIIATLLCGIADTYEFLLAARILTGVFGGVIGSIAFAIVADLFKMEVRGRVMGYLQMAFAGSQVMGIPIGLYFAKLWDWNAPFSMIVVVSTLVFAVIILYMKPIDKHLLIQNKSNAFNRLKDILVQPDYAKAFAATILLATGGFMLMPFASAFSVNNLGISLDDLFLLYMITGVFSMLSGPIIGKLADTMGKFTMFVIGTVITIILVLIYCNLGVTPLWAVMIVSVVMFVGVSSRIISSQALLTAVPSPQDRGGFMGINSSVQYLSGAIATMVAGMIVVKTESGPLENYDLLGYVVAGAMLITLVMIYFLDRMIKRRANTAKGSPAIQLQEQPVENVL